jgi:hypothetical protein
MRYTVSTDKYHFEHSSFPILTLPLRLRRTPVGLRFHSDTAVFCFLALTRSNVAFKLRALNTNQKNKTKSKHHFTSFYTPSDNCVLLMYWLLGRESKLSTSNKFLLYRAILKPIWTYAIQLWGTASTSNVDILERFQSKTLRMIVDAPLYVLNTVIPRDLQMPAVKEEIQRYSSQYSAHPNDLIAKLLELPDKRRLRRRLLNDLPTRFLVWL